MFIRVDGYLKTLCIIAFGYHTNFIFNVSKGNIEKNVINIPTLFSITSYLKSVLMDFYLERILQLNAQCICLIANEAPLCC